MQEPQEQQIVNFIASTPHTGAFDATATWAPKKDNRISRKICRRCLSIEKACDCSIETWERNTSRKLDFGAKEEIEGENEEEMVDESTPSNLRQLKSLTPCSRAATTLLARSKNIDNIGGFFPQTSKRKLLYANDAVMD